MIDLVGTAFSGAMVAFFGVPLIVIINGVSNLYSAVTEMLINVPKTVQEGTRVTVKGVAEDTLSAVKTIFSDKCLKIFVPFALILNLLGSGPLSLMLPLCMDKGFTVDMYGYLVAIYSASSLVAVVLLGAVKLKPFARFMVMSLGFVLSIPCFMGVYFANSFLTMCILGFMAGFLNCAGNTVFNASLMLALPEENRSAILGFIRSASAGGMALSAVVYGFLGEFFPLYIIFAIGSALSLAPMIYMCFAPSTKQFVIEN